MGQRKHPGIACGMFAVMLLGVSGAAAIGDEAPLWIYDTVAGVTMTYTGDLTAGTLTFNHISGRDFRVDRWGMVDEPQYGVFGTGGASFTMAVNLVSYAGGVAHFSGNGTGQDLIARDEMGGSLSSNVDTFELRESGPGGMTVEGQGLLSTLVWSAGDFQSVCLGKLEELGTLFTFQFSSGVTLEEYLASSGLGGLAVEVETLEMRVRGTACWGDLDGDGDTDQADLGQLLAAYGVDDGGDLNCDGVTDQMDLGMLLADYGCGE